MDFKTERCDHGNGNFHVKATITHEGRDFTSGGGAVIGDRACGYPKRINDSLVLTDFEGKVIGTKGRVKMFRSGFAGGYANGKMYAFSFEINGKRFYGRNGGMFGGEGCLVRLRASTRA